MAASETVKTRVTFRFPPEIAGKPLTYRLVKEFGFKVNILRAKIDPDEQGKLLMEIEASGENIEKGLQFVRSEGVEVDLLSKQVSWDENRCIHCGACTGVCIPGAFTLDRETYLVTFDPGKCIACEMCEQACPMNVVKVTF